MSGRPSTNQYEALVEFLEQNPGIAKGQLRTVQAKQETKRKWESFAVTCNSLGGASKNGAGWAKYWAEKKCALKRICSQHSSSIRSTGGGTSPNIPSLSQLDSRLVQVMGGHGFASRDIRLAVDPFPVMNVTDANLEAPVVLLPTIQMEAVPERTVTTAITPPLHNPPQQTTPRRSPRLASQHSPHPTLTHRSHIPRRRPRSTSSISLEMNRMARIEEDRVAAETVTAQAFADTSTRLDGCAAAIKQLAEAVREGARLITNALLEIAKRP